VARLRRHASLPILILTLHALLDRRAPRAGRSSIGRPGALHVEVAHELLELFARDLLARLLGRDQTPAPRAPALALGLDVDGLATSGRRIRRNGAEFARDPRATGAVAGLALLPVR